MLVMRPCFDSMAQLMVLSTLLPYLSKSRSLLPGHGSCWYMYHVWEYPLHTSQDLRPSPIPPLVMPPLPEYYRKIITRGPKPLNTCTHKHTHTHTYTYTYTHRHTLRHAHRHSHFTCTDTHTHSQVCNSGSIISNLHVSFL